MDRVKSLAAADQPRFAAYLDALLVVLGHADRIASLEAYCTPTAFGQLQS